MAIHGTNRGDRFSVIYQGGSIAGVPRVKLPPTTELNDVVYALGGHDWVAVSSGNDWVDGGTGNDSIQGWYGADTLRGGEGNDVIVGDSGDFDISVRGGTHPAIDVFGPDVLLGGTGADTFIFNLAAGHPISWRGAADRILDFNSEQKDKIAFSQSPTRGEIFTYGYGDLPFGWGGTILIGSAGPKNNMELPAQRSSRAFAEVFWLKPEAGSGGWLVIDDNRDGKLTASDFFLYVNTEADLSPADFINRPRPSLNWKFVVERGLDGQATVSSLENGRLIASTQKAAYDDATPVAAGTYDAIYRINGTNHRWEFADSSGNYNTPGRTAIQLHGGNSTHDSEGCIVASKSEFLNLVINHMKAALEGERIITTGDSRRYYDLLDAIEIELVNEIEQPKINFMPDLRVSDKFSGSENFAEHAIKMALEGDGNTTGISKRLDVYFSVRGNAVYGEDYSLGGAAVNVGGNRWKTQIRPNEAEATITLKIFKDETGATPERAERIFFDIYDVEIFRNKGGVWTISNDSKLSPNRLSETEKLLVDDGNLIVSIAADSPQQSLLTVGDWLA